MSDFSTSLRDLIRDVVRDELASALASRAAEAPTLVTVAAYAAARSISPSTVRAAIRDGRLPATRIGRAVRLDSTAEIARALAPQSRAAITAAAMRKLGISVVR